MKRGEYLYRGYKILRHGYYEPEKRVLWEGIDDSGDAVAHGYTKRAAMSAIDYFMDRQ